MPPRRFDRLALNAETGVEQRQLFRQQVRTGAGPCGAFLGDRPRHGGVAEKLAGGGRNDQRGVTKLRAVQREHVLNDERARIAVLAVNVLLDIEADDVIAFGEQAGCPAAEAARQIDCEGFHHSSPTVPRRTVPGLTPSRKATVARFTPSRNI